MKPEQQRVHNVLIDTVTLLCKNSLSYIQSLRIEGVIGITIDESEVFLVHLNDTISAEGSSYASQPVKVEKDASLHAPNTFCTPVKKKYASTASSHNDFVGQQPYIKHEPNRASAGVNSSYSGAVADEDAVHDVSQYGVPRVQGFRSMKTTFGSESSAAISSTVVTESFVMNVPHSDNRYSVEDIGGQQEYKTDVNEQGGWNDEDNMQFPMYPSQTLGKPKKAAAYTKKKTMAGVGGGRGRGTGSVHRCDQGQSVGVGRSPRGGGGSNQFVITESTHMCGYPGCGKRFRFKHDLLRHQTKVHGRQPIRRNPTKKASDDLQAFEGHDEMTDDNYYDGTDDYGGVDQYDHY